MSPLVYRHLWGIVDRRGRLIRGQTTKERGELPALWAYQDEAEREAVAHKGEKVVKVHLKYDDGQKKEEW